jgi:protein gp37
MSDKSAIEWTDATWSPIRARVRIDAANIARRRGWDDLAEICERMAGHVGPHCEMCSPGCNHCYSLTNNGRCLPNNGTGLPFDKRSRELVDIFVDENILTQPLHWKRPRKIFVENQSDLFGEFVPFEYIDRVVAVAIMAHWHTYQALTKRADRMLEYWSTPDRAYRIGCALLSFAKPPMPIPPHIPDHLVPRLPLKNWWHGVSAENQDYADKRIPLLLQTPAAVRFVSYEPALGPINFDGYLRFQKETGAFRWASGLNWVIVGGESSPKARPFEVQWARDTVSQCKAAKVPCFVKQMGSYAIERNDQIADVWYYSDGSDMDTEAIDGDSYRYQGAPVRLKLKNKKGGEPAEWPQDLRVRQFPEVANSATNSP